MAFVFSKINYNGTSGHDKVTSYVSIIACENRRQITTPVVFVIGGNQSFPNFSTLQIHTPITKKKENKINQKPSSSIPQHLSR